jgi:hypothetical protein
MTIALIIAISLGMSVIWLSIALIQELRRKQEALDLCTQKLMAWEDELSSVMPKDCTDWWKNDRAEWPMIASGTIRRLSSDNERAWKIMGRNK